MSDPTVDEILSPREWEVLQEAANGWTARETGDRLHLSEETIRSHRKHILMRMNERTMTAAVHRAHLLGWFGMPQPDGSNARSPLLDRVYGHVPVR